MLFDTDPVSLCRSQHPNVTAVAMHPGLVNSDKLIDTFRHMRIETPELVGGLKEELGIQQFQ